MSDETGQDEIYVREFPGMGGKRQISISGGAEPRWRRDSRELFYRNGTAVLAAALDTDSGLRVANRERLFAGPYIRNARWADYDVYPDGQRFIMVRQDQLSTEMVVLLNWPALVAADARPTNLR